MWVTLYFDITKSNVFFCEVVAMHKSGLPMFWHQNPSALLDYLIIFNCLLCVILFDEKKYPKAFHMINFSIYMNGNTLQQEGFFSPNKKIFSSFLLWNFTFQTIDVTIPFVSDINVYFIWSLQWLEEILHQVCAFSCHQASWALQQSIIDSVFRTESVIILACMLLGGRKRGWVSGEDPCRHEENTRTFLLWGYSSDHSTTALTQFHSSPLLVQLHASRWTRAPS